MPRAQATDGAGLHWEERGSGPTVLLAPQWSLHPMLWEPLTDELVRDHRVVRYDERGTGRSDRVGPYDLGRSTDDLETIAEAAGGGPVVAVGLMDGPHKAARIAVRRPDLIGHLVCPGGAPLGRRALQGSDAMISSNTVVGAFLQQLETDYRAAVRSLVESANPQMSQDDVRRRVAGQVEHVPLEAATARVGAWANDDEAEEPAREIGDRLVVLLSNAITGGWWPEPEVMGPLLREYFPDAVVRVIDDGIISRPDLTAAAIRECTTAGLESTASPKK